MAKMVQVKKNVASFKKIKNKVITCWYSNEVHRIKSHIFRSAILLIKYSFPLEKTQRNEIK